MLRASLKMQFMGWESLQSLMSELNSLTADMATSPEMRRLPPAMQTQTASFVRADVLMYGTPGWGKVRARVWP
jgi:hypothetical protein